jgi:hypothetical protein
MDELKESNHQTNKAESEGRHEPIGDVELQGPERTPAADETSKPGVLDALRRSFDRGWQARWDPRKRQGSRHELRKNKTKSLLALAGFVATIVLLFVLVFSSPPKRQTLNSSPGTPDLGRRVTPGESRSQENVTPLMNASPASNESANAGLATAEEVAETARLRSAGSSSGAVRHTLARINFQDEALRRQYAMHGTNPPAPSAPASSENDDLKAASLVFVRAGEQTPATRAMGPAVEENSVMDLLPAGTHLVARLEAPVSTAVQAPVLAVVEYNYEQDDEIILPAGSRVIGKLRGATPEGSVSLQFDQLEYPDGSTQKIDAVGMGLDYRPLKGDVAGRHRALRFLVQSLTGVGQVAAFMVGGSPGSTSVFSEDALLREQLAANMAMAGQEQFNQLAMTQHIVVTVPGNTRFYLVVEQAATPTSAPPNLRPVSNPPNLPSTEELMELLELKHELAAASQQGGSTTPVTAAASQP